MASSSRGNERRPTKPKDEIPRHDDSTVSSSDDSAVPDPADPVPSTSRESSLDRPSAAVATVRYLRRRNRELWTHVQMDELWTFEELQLELDGISSVVAFGDLLGWADPYELFYNELSKNSAYLEYLINLRQLYLAKQKPDIKTVPRLRPKPQRKSSFIRWLELKEKQREEGVETDESEDGKDSEDEMDEYDSSMDTSRESSPERLCYPRRDSTSESGEPEEEGFLSQSEEEETLICPPSFSWEDKEAEEEETTVCTYSLSDEEEEVEEEEEVAEEELLEEEIVEEEVEEEETTGYPPSLSLESESDAYLSPLSEKEEEEESDVYLSPVSEKEEEDEEADETSVPAFTRYPPRTFAYLSPVSEEDEGADETSVLAFTSYQPGTTAYLFPVSSNEDDEETDETSVPAFTSYPPGTTTYLSPMSSNEDDEADETSVPAFTSYPPGTAAYLSPVSSNEDDEADETSVPAFTSYPPGTAAYLSPVSSNEDDEADETSVPAFTSYPPGTAPYISPASSNEDDEEAVIL